MRGIKFRGKGVITKDWIQEYDKEIIGNIHDNPELIKEVRQ